MNHFERWQSPGGGCYFACNALLMQAYDLFTFITKYHVISNECERSPWFWQFCRQRFNYAG